VFQRLKQVTNVLAADALADFESTTADIDGFPGCSSIRPTQIPTRRQPEAQFSSALAVVSSKTRRHTFKAKDVDDVFCKRLQSLEADWPDAADLEPVRVLVGELCGVRRRSRARRTVGILQV
jgi:hypothetical protein